MFQKQSVLVLHACNNKTVNLDLSEPQLIFTTPNLRKGSFQRALERHITHTDCVTDVLSYIMFSEDEASVSLFGPDGAACQGNFFLDSADLPALQMAYLTVNDSENDNMPRNREEVISFS